MSWLLRWDCSSGLCRGNSQVGLIYQQLPLGRSEFARFDERSRLIDERVQLIPLLLRGHHDGTERIADRIEQDVALVARDVDEIVAALGAAVLFGASTPLAKLLLAAERPEISGECFSTRAVIIDSIGSAVHQGVGHCS